MADLIKKLTMKNSRGIITLFLIISAVGGVVFISSHKGGEDCIKTSSTCDSKHADNHLSCSESGDGVTENLAFKEKHANKAARCAVCGQYPENCPPEHTCNFPSGGKCSVWACCDRTCEGNGKCNIICSACRQKHINDHVGSISTCVGCRGCGVNTPTNHTGTPTCVTPCSGCNKYDYTNHGDTPATRTVACPKCGRFERYFQDGKLIQEKDEKEVLPIN